MKKVKEGKIIIVSKIQLFLSSKNNIKWLAFFLLLIYMVGVHWNLPTYISDDGTFKEILNNYTLLEQIHRLYFDINGKIFSDGMATIFTYINPFYWRIIDSFIYVIIAYAINYIFLNNKGYSAFIVSLLTSMFPFFIMNSAGWVATSTNYTWTTCSILVTLIPLNKIYYNRKIKIYELIVYSLALIFACNQEQSFAILCVVIVGFSILYIKQINSITNRRVLIYLLILMFVSGIFMITSPGHIARTQVYSQFRIPFFNKLNVIEKILLGFTSTMSYIFKTQSSLILILVTIIFLYNLIIKKNLALKIISAIPFIILITFKFLSNVLYTFFPRLREYFEFYPSNGYGMPDFKYIDMTNYTDIYAYLPIIISIIFVISLLVLFLFYSNWRKNLLVITVIGAGFCSRVVMGFSPTIYGSSFRTFSYFFFSIIIVIAIYSKDLIDYFAFKRHKLKYLK